MSVAEVERLIDTTTAEEGEKLFTPNTLDL